MIEVVAGAWGVICRTGRTRGYEKKMKNFGRQNRGRHSPSRGFSMIELVVVLVVILITSAITAPSFMRAYQYYQVSNAATSMANVIKYTRYEAIRRNTPINCVIAPAPVGTIAWTDYIANLVPDNVSGRGPVAPSSRCLPPPAFRRAQSRA